MVEAAPQSGLPAKRDYINYGADRALMALIGDGKPLSYPRKSLITPFLSF